MECQDLLIPTRSNACVARIDHPNFQLMDLSFLILYHRDHREMAFYVPNSLYYDKIYSRPRFDTQTDKSDNDVVLAFNGINSNHISVTVIV